MNTFRQEYTDNEDSMIGVLIWALVILFLYVGTNLQLRFARANYPSSWQWRLSLFGVGCLIFGLGAYGFIHVVERQPISAVALIGCSIFGGILSAWAVPIRMRYVIPKKPE